MYVADPNSPLSSPRPQPDSRKIDRKDKILRSISMTKRSNSPIDSRKDQQGCHCPLYNSRFAGHGLFPLDRTARTNDTGTLYHNRFQKRQDQPVAGQCRMITSSDHSAGFVTRRGMLRQEVVPRGDANLLIQGTETHDQKTCATNDSCYFLQAKILTVMHLLALLLGHACCQDQEADCGILLPRRRWPCPDLQDVVSAQ